MKTKTADENHQRAEGEITGAFWTKDSPSSLVDITYYINKFDPKNLSPEEAETELLHIGYMVTSYSDAQVENLDERLTEVQRIAFEYDKNLLYGDPDISYNEDWKKVTNLSLKLGSEVRQSLIRNLQLLRDFGRELDVPINLVDASTHDMHQLKENSRFFPSQWNTARKKDFTLKRLDGYYSYFSKDSETGAKEIAIGKTNEAIFMASSLDDYYHSIQDIPNSIATKSLYVHELSHYYEDNSQAIIDIGNSFVKRRGEPNYDMAGKEGPGIVYENHFASRYVGKVYYAGVNDENEIFSTGVESALTGSNGSLIGLPLPTPATEQRENEMFVHFNPDIEHRNLVTGILATIDMEKEKYKKSWFSFR